MPEEKNKTTEKANAAELTLQINEAVDARLLNLPASTYQLIENMVERRVASHVKMYHTIGIVALAALTIISAAFYQMTANKAAQTVANAIASSEVRKQAEIIGKLLPIAQDDANKIAAAKVESLSVAESLTKRLHDLEGIDNVVRYSGNGILVVKELRIERTNNEPGIMFYLDSKGVLQISDGSNSVDVINGIAHRPTPTK